MNYETRDHDLDEPELSTAALIRAEDQEQDRQDHYKDALRDFQLGKGEAWELHDDEAYDIAQAAKKAMLLIGVDDALRWRIVQAALNKIGDAHAQFVAYGATV